MALVKIVREAFNKNYDKDPNNLIRNNRSCKLLVASRTGNHKQIVELIEQGADVNYADPYNGRTPLINAAFG